MSDSKDSEEHDTEMMSMFASVWVKVEVDDADGDNSENALNTEQPKSEPPKINEEHKKLKKDNTPTPETEKQQPEQKKNNNSERAKRYRELKKAEALKLTKLNNGEEPPEIILKKKQDAEKRRRNRELKKKKQMEELLAKNSNTLERCESPFQEIQPTTATIKRIKKSQKDTENFKEDIIKRYELNAEHINNFQDIIASRYLNLRPIDVQLSDLPRNVKPVTNSQHIQICGYSGQAHQLTHWICTYYDGKVINVYDSLNKENLYTEMDILLDQLFPQKPERIFHRVRQQFNATDGGVYAIAFATSLLNNRDPSKEIYDHLKMRSHLLGIYNTTEVVPFPIEPVDAKSKKKVSKVSEDKDDSAGATKMEAQSTVKETTRKRKIQDNAPEKS